MRGKLSWISSPELQIMKSIAFCSHYGLDLISQDDKWDLCRERFADIVFDICGNETGNWCKFLTSVNKSQGTTPTRNSLQCRAYDTVRRLEKTPYHLDVVQWFEDKFGSNADDKADWDDPRYSKYRRGSNSVLLFPSELPKDWIKEGPDVLLPEGQRDPVRNFSSWTLRKSMEIHGWRCYHCKVPFQRGLCLPVADHFYPISKGGRTTLANCVPSCYRCNSQKADRWPDEFWRSLNVSLCRGRTI